MYFSGNKSRSMGVGFLFNKTLNVNVASMKEIIEGRMLALDIEINKKELILVNIYGPNKENITFFQKIETFCNDKDNCIFGGDFKIVLNPEVDKSGGNKNTHPRSMSKLKEIMDTFDLVDVWRAFNQDKKAFTWHSNTRPKILCRLDYFLLKKHMMSTVVKAEIKNSVKSDHTVVLIDLKINEIIRGPGIFKLNNSLLLDVPYKEKNKKAIRYIKKLNSEANPAVLWSLIKGAIRNETISYSSKKHKTEEENLRKLEHEIDSLEERLIQVNNNSNSNNNNKNNNNSNNNNNNNVRLQTLENNINNELRNKKEQLEEIYRIKAAGILTRLKMTHLQGSEKKIPKKFRNA